jgi:hypothetical protein
MQQARNCFFWVAIGTACGILAACDSVASSSAKARTCLNHQVDSSARSEGDALRKIVADAVRTCFAQPGTQELAEQASSALPYTVALHAGTEWPVRLNYVCSDLCPEYGRIVPTLLGMPEKQCCTMGQVPLYDNAWGDYLGCSPVELAAAGQYEHRQRCKPANIDDFTRRDPSASPLTRNPRELFYPPELQGG